MMLEIEYDDIEADTEEEAKRIAIDKAYEDIDFNNCNCTERVTAYAWLDDEADKEWLYDN